MKDIDKQLKYLIIGSIILTAPLIITYIWVVIDDSDYWIPILWSLILVAPILLYLFSLKKSKTKTKGTTTWSILILFLAYLCYFLFIYFRAMQPNKYRLSLAETQGFFLTSFLYMIPVMLILIALSYYIVKHRKYPYKIFLSYSTKDEYLAGVVNAYLTDKKKYLVVQDRTDFEFGGNLDEIIQAKITDCDIVLALLTEYSLASRWVMDEFEYTLSHLKQFNPSYIVIEFDDSLRNEAHLSKIKENAKTSINKTIQNPDSQQAIFQQYLDSLSKLQEYCNQHLSIRVENINALEIQLDKLVENLKKSR